MNAELGAKAFTQGSDMFFGKGQYAPGTPAGDRLIAHEAAHVVQGGGDVRRKEEGPAVLKKKHCVQQGETLEKIAEIYYASLIQKYGGYDTIMHTQYLDFRESTIVSVVHDIMLANNMSTPNVQPGQELKIPDLSYYGDLNASPQYQKLNPFHSRPPYGDVRYLGYFYGVPSVDNTTQMSFVISGTSRQWKTILENCVLGLNSSVWHCFVEPFIRTALNPNWIEEESSKKRDRENLPQSTKLGELKRGINVSEIKEFLRALYGQDVDNSGIDFVNIKSEFPYLGSGKSHMQQYLDEFVATYQHYLVEEIARDPHSGGTLERDTLMHFLDEGDDQVEMAVFASAFASAVRAVENYVALTITSDEPNSEIEKGICLNSITASAEILRASVDNKAKDAKFTEEVSEIFFTIVFSAITHEDSEVFEAIKNVVEPVLLPLLSKWTETGYDAEDEKNAYYMEFNRVARGFLDKNLISAAEYSDLLHAFNSTLR